MLQLSEREIEAFKSGLLQLVATAVETEEDNLQDQNQEIIFAVSERIDAHKLWLHQILKLTSGLTTQAAAKQSPQAKRAIFRGESLRGVSFTNVDLRGADFTGCDLTDCDFSGADVRFATFDGATLVNTKFSRAKR